MGDVEGEASEGVRITVGGLYSTDGFVACDKKFTDGELNLWLWNWKKNLHRNSISRYTT